MYRDDDFLTRRERINDNLLRQLLGESDEGSENMNSGRNTNRNIPHTHEQEPNCRQNMPRAEQMNKMRKTWGLTDYPLAIVYAPLQEWRKLYDNETALSRGTIFEELDLPFLATWDNAPSGNGCNSCENGCRKGCGGERNG